MHRAILALTLLLWAPVTAAQGSQAAVDYVILIDESGSMIGLPAGSDNVNILPKVKENVSSFLGQLEPGASVFVGTFSDGLKDFERFDISSQQDIDAVQRYVESVEADGSATHVYGSIETAFSEYVEWRREQPNAEHRVGTMLIYTDGKDNSGTHTIDDVLETFDAKRNRHDWLYYSTLGVDLGDREEEALDANTNTTYLPNDSGTVRPLRIVEPRYPVLDFGNLLGAGESTREMAFTVRSTGGLTDARLTATANFPDVAQQGAAVEVTPATFPLSGDNVPLTLEIVNEESLGQGVYEGTILFDAADENVIVNPAEIEVRFRYRPARTMSVQGAAGQDDPAAHFGYLSSWADTASAASAVSLPLSFNPEARREGGSYTLSIETAEGSPPLPPGMLTVNGRSDAYHELSVSDGDALLLATHVDESVPPGTYEGTMILESADLEIPDEARSIPWSLTVEERPWSLWNWLALALGVLLIGAALVSGAVWASTGAFPPWAKPKMSGCLNVIRPASAYQEIVLTGKESVAVGGGTNVLSDADARVTIRAERAGRAVVVKAVADEGAPTLQRAGERHGMAFASEKIYPGDVLIVGVYQLEFTPY